jgi:hypothetical protein
MLATEGVVDMEELGRKNMAADGKKRKADVLSPARRMPDPDEEA